jgi:hypothetical protein
MTDSIQNQPVKRPKTNSTGRSDYWRSTTTMGKNSNIDTMDVNRTTVFDNFMSKTSAGAGAGAGAVANAEASMISCDSVMRATILSLAFDVPLLFHLRSKRTHTQKPLSLVENFQSNLILVYSYYSSLSISNSDRESQMEIAAEIQLKDINQLGIDFQAQLKFSIASSDSSLHQLYYLEMLNRQCNSSSLDHFNNNFWTVSGDANMDNFETKTRVSSKTPQTFSLQSFVRAQNITQDNSGFLRFFNNAGSALKKELPLQMTLNDGSSFCLTLTACSCQSQSRGVVAVFVISWNKVRNGLTPTWYMITLDKETQQYACREIAGLPSSGATPLIIFYSLAHGSTSRFPTEHRRSPEKNSDLQVQVHKGSKHKAQSNVGENKPTAQGVRISLRPCILNQTNTSL